jgi:hypothetical protein
MATSKPWPMTPTQAEAARRILASADGLIRPVPGGRWMTERAWRRGLWATQFNTVRAMQAHGWLERCRLRTEPWLDPRRLTEAGKEALAKLAPLKAMVSTGAPGLEGG